MKDITRIFLFVSVLFMPGIGMAQSNLSSYEYWFDSEYENAVSTALVSAASHLVDSSFPTQDLAVGVHKIHVRYRDEEGRYSPVVSKLFYKNPIQPEVDNYLTEYEYWLDMEDSERETGSISNLTEFDLMSLLDLGALGTGLHRINFRFKDSRNQWSGVYNHVFFKTPNQPNAENYLVSYEYWFDMEDGERLSGSISNLTEFDLMSSLDLGTLNTGLHRLNFRFKDSRNQWSSVYNQIFFKTPVQPVVENYLVGYEYWFDMEDDLRITGAIADQASFDLITSIDLGNLTTGLHTLRIRFVDSRGIWSATQSQLFLRPVLAQNEAKFISDYRYWFDEDESSIINVSASGIDAQFDFIDAIDLTSIASGDHAVHFQFKDNAERWSPVTSDSVYKTPFPVAQFDFTSVFTCESTSLFFSDLSIDADSYLWDFGDGTTSSEGNPSHSYTLPGTYLVGLTVTNLETGLESSTNQLIDIEYGDIESIEEIEICYGSDYTFPDGSFLENIMSDLQYLSELQTTSGCDSLITTDIHIIQLDVTVNQSMETLTAQLSGADYQWLDCDNGFQPIPGEVGQTFIASQNGNYAVMISNEGCSVLSECFNVNSLSLEDLEFKAGITLSPNPTSGRLTVDLGSIIQDTQVEFLTAKGRLVKSLEFKQKQVLNVTVDGSSGVYLLRINADGRIATLTVVKE
jgi:hypothetical protein